MTHSIAQIAAALGAELWGDGSLTVERPAEPQAALAEELALAMSPAYADALRQGQARAAVLWPGADPAEFGLAAAIFAPRARLAMARLTASLDAPPAATGLHPTAFVDPGARLGANVTIGPFAVVGAGAHLDEGVWLGPHVSVAEGARIGAGSVLHAGVRIQRNVTLGARVILQPGVVIGGDGFSFVTAETSNAERARTSLGEAEIAPPEDPTWYRIHSLGGVLIGDEVEIGANSCVDAGTIRPTSVGAGTKIDNLVQVGHNVIIGRDCLLCGVSAVAGSSVLGDRVVLGGQAGVADNLSIGDDVVIGAASAVLSNVPARRIVMGYPATAMTAFFAGYKALRRLPRLLTRLARDNKAVSKPDGND